MKILEPRRGFTYFASAGMKEVPKRESTKKKLFISYSSEDNEKVEIIIKTLAYNSLFEPFIVSNTREPNKALVKKVTEGIDSAFCLISVLTSQSIKTQWINQEIGYAYCKNIPIIPIIERSILNDLKGIIHIQNDCPYTFETISEFGDLEENKSFKVCFRNLIQDLEDKQKTITEIQDGEEI